MSYNIHTYNSKKMGTTITTNDEKGKVGSVRGNQYSTRDAFGLVGKSRPSKDIKNKSKDVPLSYKTTTMLVNYENPLVKKDVPYYDQLGQNTAKQIASQISVPKEIFQRGVKQFGKDIQSSLLVRAMSPESRRQEGTQLPLQSPGIPPTANPSYKKEILMNRAKSSQLFNDELNAAVTKRAFDMASQNKHIGDLERPSVYESNVPLVDVIKNYAYSVNKQYSSNINTGTTPRDMLPKGGSDFNKSLPNLHQLSQLKQ